jgi:hypothetical protein
MGGITMDWLAGEHGDEEEGQEDNDAIAGFLRLLDDLLIYTPSTMFDVPPTRPCREDFAVVAENAEFARMVGILRQYVRPRKQVERIRKTVNGALQRDLSELDNVYGRYSRVKKEVGELRAQKDELRGTLAVIKPHRPGAGEIERVLLGKMLLDKAGKEVDVLRIHTAHLTQLLDSPEKVDNQTTLVSFPLLCSNYPDETESNARIVHFVNSIHILKARLFPPL